MSPPQTLRSMGETEQAGAVIAGPPPPSSVRAAPPIPRKRLRVARIVRAPHDMHLRIAARFVQLAARFESKIFLAKGRRRVDGKSILGILMLGAVRDSRLRVIAVGRDAEVAITVLTQLFHS